MCTASICSGKCRATSRLCHHSSAADAHCGRLGKGGRLQVPHGSILMPNVKLLVLLMLSLITVTACTSAKRSPIYHIGDAVYEPPGWLLTVTRYSVSPLASDGSLQVFVDLRVVADRNLRGSDTALSGAFYLNYGGTNATTACTFESDSTCHHEFVAGANVAQIRRDSVFSEKAFVAVGTRDQITLDFFCANALGEGAAIVGTPIPSELSAIQDMWLETPGGNHIVLHSLAPH